MLQRSKGKENGDGVHSRELLCSTDRFLFTMTAQFPESMVKSHFRGESISLLLLLLYKILATAVDNLRK